MGCTNPGHWRYPGRSAASVRRESQQIRETVGPMAQMDFDARWERLEQEAADDLYQRECGS
jgi:hypothetical protein